MNKVYVYLAGPITGQTGGGANAWRSLVTTALESVSPNIIGVSPLRCEPPGPSGIYLPQDGDNQFGTPQVIAAKNYEDVKRCDVVLAYMPSMSIGTLQEMGWAVGMRKNVVLISTLDDVLENPVIKATIPWRFHAEDQGFKKALEVIKGVYEVYC